MGSMDLMDFSSTESQRFERLNGCVKCPVKWKYLNWVQWTRQYIALKTYSILRYISNALLNTIIGQDFRLSTF